MRLIFNWLMTTFIIFLILCAISYHNDTDADGDLSVGFPKEIFYKSVRVMMTETSEIGGAERFYAGNLFIDIAFAFIIALFFVFACKKVLRRKKDKI